MFMSVTYQAPPMHESPNAMLSCPGLIPVLRAAMRESSVVPDTRIWLPLTVALIPVTWAVSTLIGVLGLIPSVTKLLCSELNVAAPGVPGLTAVVPWLELAGVPEVVAVVPPPHALTQHPTATARAQ